jgi:hypothetical protein
MPTPHNDEEFLRAACDLGASTLVPKRMMLVDLVPAVGRALNREITSSFMVRGLPHAGRFHDTMRPIIDRVVGLRHPPVWVYGEMVETICHQHSHVVGEVRR